jgi:hypothetical protein
MEFIHAETAALRVVKSNGKVPMVESIVVVPCHWGHKYRDICPRLGFGCKADNFAL